jgi:hypothetical protein
MGSKSFVAIVLLIALAYMGGREVKASPTVLMTSAPSFVSGGSVTATAVFNCDDNCGPGVDDATLTAAGATGPSLTFLSCTYDSDGDTLLTDETLGNCNGVAADDCGAVGDASFCFNEARLASIDVGLSNQLVQLQVTLTATCAGPGATPITLTATQEPPPNTMNTVVNCQAPAVQPFVTVSNGSFASGGSVQVTAVFNLDDPAAFPGLALSVSASGGTGTTLALISCTVDSDDDGSLTDEAVANCLGPGDDDGAANVFGMVAGRVGGLDVNATSTNCSNTVLFPPPNGGCIRLVLSITATCTTNTAITLTATQNAASANGAVVCLAGAAAPTANSITVSKVDQLGNRIGATFSIQAGSGCTGVAPTATCTWAEVYRAIVGTSAASNPCTVPTEATCIAGGVSATTLGNGIHRVVEIAQPSNCTLVEVRDGTGALVAPFAGGAQADLTGTTAATFVFVNSCALAGTPR